MDRKTPKLLVCVGLLIFGGLFLLACTTPSAPSGQVGGAPTYTPFPPLFTKTPTPTPTRMPTYVTGNGDLVVYMYPENLPRTWVNSKTGATFVADKIATCGGRLEGLYYRTNAGEDELPHCYTVSIFYVMVADGVWMSATDDVFVVKFAAEDCSVNWVEKK